MASHTKPRHCNQPQHPAHDDVYLDIRVSRFIHKTLVLTPNERAAIWPFACNIEASFFVLNRGRPPLRFALDLATMYRSPCVVDINRLSTILYAGDWFKDAIAGSNRTDVSGSESSVDARRLRRREDPPAVKRTPNASRSPYRGATQCIINTYPDGTDTQKSQVTP